MENHIGNTFEMGTDSWVDTGVSICAQDTHVDTVVMENQVAEASVDVESNNDSSADHIAGSVGEPVSEAQQIAAASEFAAELSTLSHKQVFNQIAATRGEQMDVDIDDLHILPGFNVRIRNPAHEAHIRQLANSMLQVGFYKDKPISCIAAMQGNKAVLYITDGHCRYEAALLARKEGAPLNDLPVVLKDKSTTMEDLTVAMVLTNEGKRLSPMEIAIACKRLVSYNWKVPMIAQKLLITPEYVGQLLTLAGAPKVVRDMVSSGEATAATALQAMSQHGSEAAQVLGESLDRAKAHGKAKVTAKFLPDQANKKVMAKAAPQMFTVIEQVKTHAMFESLPDTLKAMIDEILGKLAPVASEQSA